MFRVTVCEETLQNSKIELEDVIQNALTLKRMTTDHNHRKLIEEMISRCPLEVVNRLQPYKSKDEVAVEFVKADYEALIALNARLKN